MIEPTSFSPLVRHLSGGIFRGRTIRHTVRAAGTSDWLLIYTVKGGGLYHFDGGSYSSGSHDVTLFRPGAFHDYQWAPEMKGWDLFYAHFLPRAEWIPWLRWPELAPGLMLVNVGEKALQRRVMSRLQDMVRFNKMSQTKGEIFGLNALEEVLLWCDSINPQADSFPVDARVRKAMDFLCTHFAESFSEENLAQAVGLSPSRLRFLFKKQMKESPFHFLERYRVLRAQELLALSQQTIAEIAFEVGFQNPFYFTLRFKKLTGESPSAFRKRTIQHEGGVRE